MRALDTNILVRFFIGDVAAETNKVYRIFKQTEDERSELWIPTLVIIELIWVFEFVYKFKRPNILKTLENLILMPVFKFENLSIVQAVVQEVKVTKFDLSDLLIAYSVSAILTFDKKATKHSMFELVL